MRGSSPVLTLVLSVPLAGALLWTLPSIGNAAPATVGPAQVIYSSPAPGARLVKPETNLILRFDRDPGALGLDLQHALAVTGSRSGTHAGRTMVADDGRTLVFQPSEAFVWGEHVEAALTSGPPPGTGALGAAETLRFDIAAGPSPRLPDAGESVRGLPRGEIGARPLAAAGAGATDTLPLGYPLVTSTLYGAISPGRLFAASFPLDGRGSPYLLIMDDSGAPIFYRATPYPCYDFKLQPTGVLTYYDSRTYKFYALNSEYAIADSFACGGGYLTDVHELRLLPNGHALLLADDVETVDMSGIVPGGDTAAAVVGLVIQELDAQKNVVFQWRSWDHFQVTDATHEDLTAATIDYVHGNALDEDTDGNLLLSSRHLDEITKIDRNTGDILWRWGGKHNQFTFLGDTLQFSHQHAVRRIANGDITLFDNGNYHVPPFSRAVEYSLDEVHHTAQRVWQFRNTPDTFGAAMGFVQRLDNGATLVSWGLGKPDVIEVSPDGAKLLELSLPPNVSSYRVFRQDWMPDEAAEGVDSVAAVVLTPNYPNPFRGQTEMQLSLPAATTVSFRIFDSQGREVRRVLDSARQGSGVYRVRIDLTGYAAGIYYCRIVAGSVVQSRKIVHLN